MVLELREFYQTMVSKESGQVVMRELEDRLRHEAVMFVSRQEERGLSCAEACRMLSLAEPTVRVWRSRRERGELVPCLLGRPGYDCDTSTASTIRAFVEEIGYEVSVLFVAEKFSDVPRAVVEAIVRTFKEEVRRGRRMRVKTLTWEGPGRVWSLDWTDPEATIDGRYEKVLMVRDLAAKWNLLSLPAKKTSGRLAERAVEHLFIYYGAPLVMKMDGGPEFKEKRFRNMLRDYGVTVLLSPGYYPQYNGAVEAGIGSLKTHTFYEAVRRGHNGHWTADDVEAGRLKANETSRPWGWRGPSPDRKWAGRTEIGCDEWHLFRDTLAAERKRWIVADRKKDRKQWEAEERMAITSALDLCGYLEIGHRTTMLKVVNG